MIFFEWYEKLIDQETILEFVEGIQSFNLASVTDLFGFSSFRH